MNRPFAFSALILLLTAGCAEVGDVADVVRSPLPVRAAEEPTQAFSADVRRTFDAARTALERMGFRFVSGGPAQGRMEAMSEVAPGEIPGSSHQYTLRAQFEPSLDGKSTTVRVQMTEVVEDDSERRQGMGTEAPLRDTALSEAFFHHLQGALDQPK